MADGVDIKRPNYILPPSPNWYCSSAANCSIDGAYAFAAKSHVFVLDINSEPPAFRGQFSEHGDRVSAVSSSRVASTKLFVSASDDKTVKLWDKDSEKLLASHNTHQVRRFRFQLQCSFQTIVFNVLMTFVESRVHLFLFVHW